jgi:predicted RNA-binding Zn-ribbon protein involved in translation (DUF1610 family)
VHLRRNGTKAARPSGLHLAHHGQHIRCSRCYLPAARLPGRCRHLCRCRGKGGVAEADTTRLRDGQGRARALADQPGFQLGNRRHLRDQELADRPGRHSGKVAEHDTGLAAALHHGQQEARVARQPVQLGDDQHGPAGAAGGERGGKLRPIGTLAALHLLKLRHHLAAGLGDVSGNGLALRLKAKARSALAIGRDPEIADKTGAGRGHGPSLGRVYHFVKRTFDRMIRRRKAALLCRLDSSRQHTGKAPTPAETDNMPIELGTIAGSESLIRDLYIDLRKRIAAWASLTKQTSQARMGYVGQHLVSVVTGFPGGRSGARGYDLSIPGKGFGEIKTCYRVDQLGKCLSCGQPVAPGEPECPHCGATGIRRNDDSKWLIGMAHEGDLGSILDPYRYYLVLFDFTDMQNPDTVRASIWEVDPLAPGFAYCMIDYWYNIRARSTSKAPFNMWPFQLKFDLMRPLLIYRSFIHGNTIRTEVFPGINVPVYHVPQSLPEYARSQNLTGEKLKSLASLLEIDINTPATQKRAFLSALQLEVTRRSLHADVVIDALAKALYFTDISQYMDDLPGTLPQRLRQGGLID